jgi:hypothetical protein
MFLDFRPQEVSMKGLSTCATASLRLSLGLALGLGACSGTIGGPGSSPSGTGNGNGNGGNGSMTPGGQTPGNTGMTPGGGGSGNPPGMSSAGGPEVPGRTPLRRLTHAEYNNTIRDLLGLKEDFAAGLAGDEEAGGFAANTSPVSEAQAEQYHVAADTIATKAVAAGLTKLAPCASTPGDACVDQFVRSFGRRAFRRPLTNEEIDRYKTVHQAGATGGDFASGVQLVVTAMLESPNFLYLPELGDRNAASADGVPLDPFETAARLSYFLIGSMPDDALSAAADAGALKTPEQIAEHGRRLLGTPAARESMISFYLQWLEMTDLSGLDKDPMMFPQFNPTMRTAMGNELGNFASRTTLEGDGKLETLLSASYSYPTAELAPLYGAPAAGADGSKRVDFPAGQRAGLLTLSAVMSLYSQPDQSSPVGRGYLVADKLLCATPPPPPNNVVPKLPAIDPNVSTRERLERHRAEPACASCHALFDPYGMAFEIYDPIGRYRTKDGNKTVDASGKGIAGWADFKDATELMPQLAKSDQVRSCLTKQWFRYAVGRVERPEDDATLASAQGAFAKGNYNIRDLLVGIASTRGFRYRTPAQP